MGPAYNEFAYSEQASACFCEKGISVFDINA